ncbi:MAG: ABC transporter permease [Thermoleophilaceae bacterium]
MRRYTLRGLMARHGRAAGMAMAVFLGVSLVVGTLVFTATINRSFGQIFKTVYAGTDVVITSRQLVAQDDGNNTGQPFSARVLDRVRRVDGVRRAAGGVAATGRVVDEDGDKLGNQFAPNFIFSLSPKPFEAQTFPKGRPPRTGGEVALDQSTADRSGTGVGDTIGVVGKDRLQRYKVVGLSKLGETSGGGSVSVTMTLPAARKIAGRRGKLDQISIQAAPGVAPEALSRRVAEVLPRALLAETGDQTAKRNTDDIQKQLQFLPTVLLVLAGIVIVVAAFLIFNTFNITVAQRIREFGLLRTLGASRRQIRRNVILEAGIIAVIGSLAGLAGGLGAAYGLKALFKAIGVDLPAAGLEFKASTAVIAVVLGVVVTLVAALTPAIRATRVTPMAALLEAELPERRGSGRGLAIVAGVLGVGGLALVLFGLFGHIESAGNAAGLLGGGAAAVLFAVSLFSPRLVKPLASIAGRPLELVSRLPGRLARENAIRKPGRTAVTAAALMIGLALVTFVTVFVAGLKGSIDSAIDDTLRSDVIVQNLDGFSPIPIGAVRAVQRADGVKGASTLASARVKVRGVKGTARAGGVDPGSVASAINVKWSRGSDAVLRDLGPREAVIAKGWSKSNGIGIGETFRARGPNGAGASFKAVGVVDDDTGFLGDFTIRRSVLSEALGEDRPTAVLASFGADAPKGESGRLATLIKKRFPSAEALDQGQLKEQQRGQLDPIIGLFYGALGLAIIVSLIGIVVTLFLSIQERTRELGMLRAVGMSRRQVRRVIRYEAVITAEIGAILGLTLGVVFAVLVSRPLADEGFKLAIPVGTLVVLLLLAALAGVLAAVLPARRAAGLEVLEAISYE